MLARLGRRPPVRLPAAVRNRAFAGKSGDPDAERSAGRASPVREGVRVAVRSPKGLKNRGLRADAKGMLILLALLTVAYFAGVVWLRRTRRTTAAATEPAPELPIDDQPPATAVGWPPAGTGFTSYVDEGFAALDAYLSEGFAA